MRLLEIDASSPVPCVCVRIEIEERCPNTFYVRSSAVFQAEGTAEIECGEGVANILPIEKVVRAQDRRARRKVHSRSGVVVRIADSSNVKIGEVLPEDGVIERRNG